MKFDDRCASVLAAASAEEKDRARATLDYVTGVLDGAQEFLEAARKRQAARSAKKSAMFSPQIADKNPHTVGYIPPRGICGPVGHGQQSSAVTAATINHRHIIGTNVRLARQGRHVLGGRNHTQGELAERIREESDIKLSQKRLSEYENGRYEAPYAVLKAIAEITRIPNARVGWFMDPHPELEPDDE